MTVFVDIGEFLLLRSPATQNIKRPWNSALPVGLRTDLARPPAPPYPVATDSYRKQSVLSVLTWVHRNKLNWLRVPESQWQSGE